MTSPPPQATARLKVSAYGHHAGDQVAHRVVGRKVEVEFLNASFFGGKKVIELGVDEFKKYFELIKK